MQRLFLDECRSHVLFILDCCHAAASITYAHARSLVESIVASGVLNLALFEGKDSFTTHLAETLKECLANEEPVFVPRLCTMVADRLRSTQWKFEESKRVTPHHLVYHNTGRSILLGPLDPSVGDRAAGSFLGYAATVKAIPVQPTNEQNIRSKVEIQSAGRSSIPSSSATGDQPSSIIKTGEAVSDEHLVSVVLSGSQLQQHMTSSEDKLPVTSAHSKKFQPRPSPPSKELREDHSIQPGSSIKGGPGKTRMETTEHNDSLSKKLTTGDQGRQNSYELFRDIDGNIRWVFNVKTGSESGPEDAQGPLGFVLFGRLLARRQAAGVGLNGRDGQALGRGGGFGFADAQGPFELGLVGRLLAGRQTAGVGLKGRDGQALGGRDGLDSLNLLPTHLLTTNFPYIFTYGIC